MNKRDLAIWALEKGRSIQNDISNLGLVNEPEVLGNRQPVVVDREDVVNALRKISENLSNSYIQVKQDIKNTSRISWAGTAHEIREIVANLLRILAPDNDVKSQIWFSPETKDGRPSHKQRVRHILQSKKTNSAQTEVVEKVAILDEMIAELVRSIYTRGSVAAHTYETRKEVLRILNYFEAFAHDLLELE